MQGLDRHAVRALYHYDNSGLVSPAAVRTRKPDGAPHSTRSVCLPPPVDVHDTPTHLDRMALATRLTASCSNARLHPKFNRMKPGAP